MILPCSTIDAAVQRAAPFITKGYRVKATSSKHIELEATPKATLDVKLIVLVVKS